MSESTPQDQTGTDEGSEPDHRMVPDSALPEDLQPDKNPLAAAPEDTEDAAPPGVPGQDGQPG